MTDTGLQRGEDYDGVELTGDLTGQVGDNARFLESSLVDVDLTDCSLSRVRFAETRLERARGTAIDLSESTWFDCDLLEPRFGAVQAYAAQLRHVRVRGGRIDFLNLRGATLVDVTFEDCVLVEADLAGAKLTRVSFAGCRLREPDFSNVTLADVDLTGAELESPRGLSSLRGATLSRLQLFDLAPALADQLGILVAD